MTNGIIKSAPIGSLAVPLTFTILPWKWESVPCLACDPKPIGVHFPSSAMNECDNGYSSLQRACLYEIHLQELEGRTTLQAGCKLQQMWESCCLLVADENHGHTQDLQNALSLYFLCSKSPPQNLSHRHYLFYLKKTWYAENSIGGQSGTCWVQSMGFVVKSSGYYAAPTLSLESSGLLKFQELSQIILLLKMWRQGGT